MLLENGWRLPYDSLVAVCPCLGYLQDLSVHLETSHLLHCSQNRFLAVEHHEGLSLTLQTLLDYDIENRAIVFEDGRQGFFHGFDLDALFQVIDLE